MSPLARAVEQLEPRRLLHGDVNLTFNFQPASTPTPSGAIADSGLVFGDRGNGYAYGWSANNTANVRDRNMVANQLLDTVAFMQNGTTVGWELEIANGDYDVTIGSGDARYRDGVHDIRAENTRVMYGIQSSKKQFLKVTKTVTVTDGRLSLSVGPDAVGAKINYVTIRTNHDVPHDIPTVSITAPDDSATEGEDDGLFRLTRTSESVSEPLTVQLAWSGSAGKKDIRSRPGLITFPANVSTYDIPVQPIDDALDESLETATATVVALSGVYTVGSPSKASVFVVGEEPDVIPDPEKPTITVAAIDNTASEAGGTGLIRFTRTSEQLSSSLVVNLNWTGSANHNDVDQSAQSVTFPANQSTVDLVISAIDDSLDESLETATISIAGPGGSDLYVVGSPSSADVLIEDNDEPPALSNVTWSSTTAPPISFSESTSVVLNNRIYLFGGFNGAFVPQSNVYSYNGTSWTTHANSPKAFTHTGHANISNTVAWFAGGYIGNGSGQTFGTTEVLTYNASTDTWGTAPALPSARASGNLVKVDNFVYYFGGENFNRTADMTTMWALDLNNQNAGWVTKASMPMSRNHASALEVDGKIYVLGGQTSYDDNLVAHDDIQIYDPANNTWTVASQTLPGNRSHTSQSAFYHLGKIVMVTGESAHNVPVNTVWSIDPDTLTTTSLNNFPDSRFSVAAAIFNDKLYAFGGYAGYIPNTAYVGTFVLS